MAKYLNCRYELMVIAVSLMLSVLVYSGVYSVTKTKFELLGSAAIPRVVAISLFVLALLKGIQVIKAIRNDPNNGVIPTDDFWKSLIIFSLVGGFVLCIAVFKFSFWIAVFVFLLASILFLKKPQSRWELLKLILFSLLFSLGVDYLFTKVFYFGL